MMRCRYILLISLIFTIAFGFGQSAQANKSGHFKIGYFEAGQSPVHSLLREELERQFKALSPENTKMVFVPYGYGSADWKRDSCRTLARMLSATKGIDLMVAIGPWVVEDLLSVGYDGPILGMRQPYPQVNGLIESTGRPATNNLTIHIQPNKIENDLAILTKLIPVKKLGLLFFSSDSLQRNAIVNRVETAGHQIGFETVTAEGYDNFNTYAYFKALNKLPRDIDAIYLGPLWSMDVNQIDAFLERLSRMRIPTFTWEGKFLVNNGAFATGSAHSIVSEARFNALKAVKIAKGETPADLTVAFQGGTSLAINEGTAQLCGVNLTSFIREEADIISAPTPEGAEYYDLIIAVSRAVAANPGYLAASDAVKQAAIASRQATAAAYLPYVDLTAHAGYIDNNTIANTADFLSNSQYRADLNIHQTLFSLNKIEEIKLGSKRENLSEVNRHRVRLDLELAVIEAYLKYLQAVDLYKIQIRYRQFVEHNLEIAATRFHIEDENQQGDFLRWKGERQQAIIRILTARTEKKAAEITLNTLFNLPIEKPLHLDSNFISGDNIYRDLDLLKKLTATPKGLLQFEQFLVREAHENNPDQKAYNVKKDIQKSLLAMNRNRYFPELALKASFSLADELENRPDFSEHHNTWSVFGQFSLPLFDGTDKRRERNRLKAGLSEIEFKADAVGLEQTGKIYRLVGSLTSLARSVPRNFQSRDLALQNLELVSEGYESGDVDISGLLDAYHHALDTETNTIILRCRYFSIMARLIHSIGWSCYDEGSTFRSLFRYYLQQFLKQ
ncbi:MAG: ABC transporter substrate binding protein [candidate division Zixibacteria bacterium]|nr:ABC transporter substrate binding protein [candidate division Zixibacteria bacterium]